MNFWNFWIFVFIFGIFEYSGFSSDFWDLLNVPKGIRILE